MKPAPLFLETLTSPKSLSALQVTPAFGLTHPDVQTMTATLGRRMIRQSVRSLATTEQRRVLTTAHGVRLETFLNTQANPAPLMILLPGWLGCQTSTYVASLAHRLHRAGFNVARLNLRDHGDSSGLNEGLFNSARIEEVVDACAQLTALDGITDTGLVGFSLGGNFALRIAERLQVKTLAVCPAIDPHATMLTIDRSVYRHWFIRKWQRSLRAKQAAFPKLYDFSGAANIRTVCELTDYFVAEHSGFPNTADYFAAYDLRGVTVPEHAFVIATVNDPVIPIETFASLKPRALVANVNDGGHCGFLANWRLESSLDPWVVAHFGATLEKSAPIADRRVTPLRQARQPDTPDH